MVQQTNIFWKKFSNNGPQAWWNGTVAKNNCFIISTYTPIVIKISAYKKCESCQPVVSLQNMVDKMDFSYLKIKNLILRESKWFEK